ncbi:MAG: PIN domain-containing protein [Robiginitomaculum sp.]|nr:MAG: PIN domain-containing protein [Robiginitomaculum sp.]
MTVKRVYWDSDCFLGWFNDETGKAEKCDGVIQQAERGEVLIVTSTLTLAEVLWMRGEKKLSQDKAENLQKFFRRSYIRLYNVTRKVAESAQTLVWDNSIKPKDAIHVATALNLGIETLETFDRGLIKQSGKVGDPLLKIREPEAAMQGRLNLGKKS